MSAQLVVNADDFGLTEGTNRAILDAHRHGIVTSTSLLANGVAFDHAVELARSNQSLGIGVHLTLTEGFPLSDAMRKWQPGGIFPLTNQPYARAMITGKLPRKLIRHEFEAQVAKIIDAGIQPTHVDGHKYIHLLPAIADIVAEVARAAGIPVMRLPRPNEPIQRPARLPGMLALAAMGRMAQPFARRAGLKSSDRFVGFIDTGHLNVGIITRLLRHVWEGVTELVCHPAYPNPQLDMLLKAGYQWIAEYNFAAETAAVSSPDLRRLLEKQGWRLANFQEAFTKPNPTT